MSGARTPTPPPAPAGAAASADPSMEDILASIRRILSEDEPGAAGATGATPPAAEEDDVLDLDNSMLVGGAPAEEPAPAPAPEPEPEPEPMVVPVAAAPEPPPPSPPPPPPLPAVSAGSELLAPETEVAVASSVGGLLRTLVTDREQVGVYRGGGPTIEDLVREEIRPMLKLWLDTNLQPLVERIVRAEIERAVNRAVS